MPDLRPSHPPSAHLHFDRGKQLGGGPSAAVSAFVALSYPWLHQASTGGGQTAQDEDRATDAYGTRDGSLLPTVRHRDRSWASAQAILGSREQQRATAGSP